MLWYKYRANCVTSSIWKDYISAWLSNRWLLTQIHLHSEWRARPLPWFQVKQPGCERSAWLETTYNRNNHLLDACVHACYLESKFRCWWEWNICGMPYRWSAADYVYYFECIQLYCLRHTFLLGGDCKSPSLRLSKSLTYCSFAPRIVCETLRLASLLISKGERDLEKEDWYVRISVFDVIIWTYFATP